MNREFFDAGGFLGEAAAMADAHMNNGAVLRNAGTRFGASGAPNAAALKATANELSTHQPASTGAIGQLLTRAQSVGVGPNHAVSAGYLMGLAYGGAAHRLGHVSGNHLADHLAGGHDHAAALSLLGGSNWPAATIQQRFQAQINEYGKIGMKQYWAPKTKTLMGSFSASIQ